MKKIILGSVLAVAAVTSIPAHAVSFCSGGVAKDGAAATAADTAFVKVAFTPKCSANVFLNGNDRSATVYTVGSASIKGKTRFSGSSVGGAVGNAGLCSGTPPLCSQTDASDASDAAPSS